MKNVIKIQIFSQLVSFNSGKPLIYSMKVWLVGINGQFITKYKIQQRQMQIELGNNQNVEHLFFLFVNSGSGASVGAMLLQQQIQRIQFVLPPQQENEQSCRCSVFIFNMRKNRDAGFKRLKLESEKPNNKCYAIVCGGDGTVMWVVTQLVNHQIKVASIPIGVIPMGTGNDFSRELGWGYQKSSLLEQGFKNLKKQIRKWINAKQQYFDIWDIEAEIYDDGKFEKVEGVNNVLIPGKTFKKTFCNYFSFGIDGKIGYSFDMHRTKSRIGNLAMYACMGLVKTMTRTKNLDQLLDSIQIHSPRKIKKTQSLQPSVNSKFQQDKTSTLIKCESNLWESTEQKQTNSNKFTKDYYNILALNINSYTGGVTDIWDKAKNGFMKNNKYNQYEEISTSDGKLEIVSFGSSFGIAMERMIGGFSKKVAQGQGPFVFNFHRYENRPKHRTYLQIDGEFVRFTNPKKVTIMQSEFVPKSKIKVLRNIQRPK